MARNSLLCADVPLRNYSLTEVDLERVLVPSDRPAWQSRRVPDSSCPVVYIKHPGNWNIVMLADRYVLQLLC